MGGHFIRGALRGASVLFLVALVIPSAPFVQSQPISQGQVPGTTPASALGTSTYSIGWLGVSMPTTGETNSVFQQFWANEAMLTSPNSGSAFWIQNDTGTQTSCTVPWMASTIETLSLAQSYGMKIAVQLPAAYTDYGSTSYASLATDNYTNGLTTYNSLGQVAQGYLRVDTPLFSGQIYSDLLAMDKCFGQFSSWVGISQATNAADLGGYDWYGPPGGSGGAGMHGLGNQTIHDWLQDPYFYVPAGNDSSTYNMATNEPKVSTLSVFYNINAYHLQQFNNFLAWNDYNQVQLAINMFYQHTGKKLVYLDYDHQGVDRIYDFPVTQVPALFKNITSVVLSGSQPCRPSSSACLARIMGNVDPATGVNTDYMYSPGQCSVNNADPPRQLLLNYMYLYPYSGGITTGFQVDSSATSCSGVQNVNSNEFSVFNQYGALLDRMKGVGSFYGVENPSAPRVLLVYQPSGDDQNLGGEVAQILGSSDINVTVTTDMNLTGIQLSDYNAILYRPYTGFPNGGAVLTVSAALAVRQFVQNGGGLVAIPSTINGYWSAFYWNLFFSGVFGVRASQVGGFVPGGTISVSQPSSEILKPYGSSVLAGGYQPGASGGLTTGTLEYTQASSSVSTIIESSNLGPEAWTNTFGSGRAVMLPGGTPLSTAYGYSSYDAYWTLVSNALMYASGNDALIPVLSYPSFYGGAQHEPWDQSTMYSILGSPSSGLLAWFFTNKTGGDSVSLQLSASAYSVSTSGWVAVDAYDWGVVGKGSGSTIDLNVNIPAAGWYPVYIFSDGGNGAPLYSNLGILSATMSGTTATYKLSGPPSFSSWLVAQLSAAPTSVSTSDTGSLAKYSTLSSLGGTIVGEHWTGSSWQNMTQTGWYYDSTDGLLYVHFAGWGSVTVTASTQAASVPSSLGPVSVAPPTISPGTTVTISGKVYDQYSTPMAGVAVSLMTTSGATIASAVTDSSGTYAFAGRAPAPGTFTLNVEVPGTTLSKAVTITVT